ncbi:NAD(P)/FAD-dependent oxidoreductase [Haladaptatus sp. ZSTT2]|uniref:NAD(P)/FAD-dependent oxidoreductase n=1 Tax=Haladaptatus sp. ZSTT2 TaxID=3120515 RepID=UPI00300E7195
MEPIVIVGGGIIGASIASHLKDDERPVVVYEQDTVGSGTSGDSVAVFVWHQSTPDPLSHRLRARAWDTYEPLIRDGTLSFEQIGTLDVAFGAEGATMRKEVAATLDSFGVSASFLEPESLAAHGLEPAAVAGALYTPDDGYLDPSEIIQHFLKEASSQDVTVETKTAVTAIRIDADGVTGVETEAGFQPAHAVINAAGPWAPAVNRMVGISLPLRHNLGPVVVLQKDAPFTLPFIEFEDGLYVRGEGDRQAFAGQFGASYDEADELQPDEARSVAHDFYLDIDARIEDAIPRLSGVELVNEWVGMRTLTPDGVPFVGETAVTGFYVACGMNGLGVTLAPAIGEVLAEMVGSGSVNSEIEEYLRPGRVEKMGSEGL